MHKSERDVYFYNLMPNIKFKSAMVRKKKKKETHQKGFAIKKK